MIFLYDVPVFQISPTKKLRSEKSVYSLFSPNQNTNGSVNLSPGPSTPFQSALKGLSQEQLIRVFENVLTKHPHLESVSIDFNEKYFILKFDLLLESYKIKYSLIKSKHREFFSSFLISKVPIWIRIFTKFYIYNWCEDRTTTLNCVTDNFIALYIRIFSLNVPCKAVL